MEAVKDIAEGAAIALAILAVFVLIQVLNIWSMA